MKSRILAAVAAVVCAFALALPCAAWADMAGTAPASQTIAGSTRYETAAQTARQWVAENGETEGVIVASGAGYADALSASGLAGLLGYPVLLTDPNQLQACTLTALKACGSSLDVIVVGGTAAVSAAVERELEYYDSDGSVTRLAGSDRYATNDAILAYGASHGGWQGCAVVATGANYADALAASPYAYWAKAPVVLTGGSLSARAVETLKACVTLGAGYAAVVTGGTAAVSETAYAAVSAVVSGNVKRLSGETRYETGLQIVKWEMLQGMTLEGMGCATGANFPDALASGPLLGARGSVLALASPDASNNTALLEYLAPYAGTVSSVTFLGGTAALPQSVRDSVIEALSTGIYVGGTITLGTYEQDNDTSDGAEAIKWKILAIEDGKALVISKYALDCQPYNTVAGAYTWETCSLRTWLNSSFYNTAFSTSDKARILTTEVVNTNNIYHGTAGGNNTSDKVFALSDAEAKTYFANDEARECAPTAYALAKGVWQSTTIMVDGVGACPWWTRTPAGYTDIKASVVDTDGKITEGGDSVDYARNAVRPVMWVTL